MNTQETARLLLNRRNAMNPVIYPGEMIAALGSESMQEALQKRWLVPDHVNGLLTVSAEMAKIDEMREVSAKCPACGKAECDCATAAPVSRSHGYAFEHALRHHDGSALQEAVRASNSVQELLSPGTGHENDNGLKGPVPLTPTTPPAPTVPPTAKPAVGEEALGAVTKSKEGNLEVKLDQTNPASKKLAQQLATK